MALDVVDVVVAYARWRRVVVWAEWLVVVLWYITHSLGGARRDVVMLAWRVVCFHTPEGAIYGATCRDVMLYARRRNWKSHVKLAGLTELCTSPRTRHRRVRFSNKLTTLKRHPTTAAVRCIQRYVHGHMNPSVVHLSFGTCFKQPLGISC